jgi:energy-converting hydrogenase Eha subunit C
MNIGYLCYSGVSDSGDWYDVIAGLPMQPILRIALIAIGIVGYIGVMRLLAVTMASQIRRSPLDSGDVRRVIIVSYVAGSFLLVLGSAMNPIKRLILLSGVAVGFAGTFGLVPVTGWIEHVTGVGVPRAAVRFSACWILSGVIVAAAFVLLLGPSVQLRR